MAYTEGKLTGRKLREDWIAAVKAETEFMAKRAARTIPHSEYLAQRQQYAQDVRRTEHLYKQWTKALIERFEDTPTEEIPEALTRLIKWASEVAKVTDGRVFRGGPEPMRSEHLNLSLNELAAALIALGKYPDDWEKE